MAGGGGHSGLGASPGVVGRGGPVVEAHHREDVLGVAVHPATAVQGQRLKTEKEENSENGLGSNIESWMQIDDWSLKSA